jgi:cupin fold WbuC family metalloprotein
VKVITADLLDELAARAARLDRRRTHHNVHESPSDPIQRLFVAADRGSYFRPHRHPTKWEFAVVIRGRFEVVLLDDSGCVTERLPVGPGAAAVGFEIPANAWHTWVPTDDGSVFVEVKPGPYDARSAAEFAAWAPPEGSPDVGRFLEALRAARVGDQLGRRTMP